MVMPSRAHILQVEPLVEIEKVYDVITFDHISLCKPYDLSEKRYSSLSMEHLSLPMAGVF